MNVYSEIHSLGVASEPRRRRQVFRTQDRLRARCAICIATAVLVGIVLWNGLLFRSVQSETGVDGAGLVAAQTTSTHDHGLFAQVFQPDPEVGHFAALGPAPDGECDPDKAQHRKIFGSLPADTSALTQALAQSCARFDLLMPDWFMADDRGLRLVPELSTIPRPGGVLILPDLPADTVLPLIRASGLPPSEARLQSDISTLSIAYDIPGFCLNLSELQGSNQQAWITFVAGQNNTLLSCLVVAAEQVTRLPDPLVAQMEKIIVLAFPGNVAGAPAALVDQHWFKQIVPEIVAHLPAEKRMLMLAAEGRSWRSGQGGSEAIGFADIMQRLQRYSTRPYFDPVSGNSSAGYIDEKGQRHQIWFADAVTLFNQMQVLDKNGIEDIGVWNLGHADPGVWSLLQDPLDVAHLRISDLSRHIVYTDAGPFHSFEHAPVTGQRNIDVSEGRITGVSWAELPRPWQIRRWGAPQTDLIALTFDDGPDERYTGRILDILRDHNTPATFFALGASMLGQNDIMRRMQAEGHTFGLHGFSHSHLEDMGEWWLESEIRLQQRMFATMTGQKPILFRPPYVPGSGPLRPDVARQMQRVDAMGYITLGSDIVPPDWTDLSADEITDYVVSEVQAGKGNVILLHDGGGDRENTVKALPEIIVQLRSLGYEFTDAAGLIGRENLDLMPSSNPGGIVETMSFAVAGFFRNYFHIGFALMIGIGLLRCLIMLLGVWKRRPAARTDPEWAPSVCVIVPAYNEEKVILRTVRSILASDYKNLSVLVINDGSTDDTLVELYGAYATDARVTVLSQRNQGKWAAANTAVECSRSDIIVAIDADTLVDRDAIRLLVQRMSDPKVGAVAGNVQVGNPNQMLTRLQALEYISAQQIERRT